MISLNPRPSRAQDNRKAIFYFLLLSFGLLALTVGCLREIERGKFVDGRSLRVGVILVRTNELAYMDASTQKHYVVRPKDPERNMLAITKVTLANYRSARISMFIDATSATVDDEQNKRYGVFDPFKERQEVPAGAKEENVYGQFPLWGNVDLDRNMQVTGWMVFEIPKESEISRFQWSQGESIVVRFCEEPC